MKQKFFSLKRKLIMAFLIFFILIIITSVYINLAYRLSSTYFEKLLNKNQELKGISERLQALSYYTEAYLSKGRDRELEAFYSQLEEIEKLKKQIKVINRDLWQLIEVVLQQARSTVSARQEEKNYYENHVILSNTINLSQKYVVKLINQNNLVGIQKYNQSRKYLQEIEYMGILLSIFTGLLCILFLIYFSLNITSPLKRIMNNAREIACGNFNVPPITVKTNDELKTIALAFNEMADDIRGLFARLKEKIGLERELQREKVENLKMTNLLKEAELKQLQSQVNPHFLYNTLNTISQVAILEEADQTGSLIKKVASLLRYNLKQTNRFVPLQEEIDNIKTYCHIMEVRYGNQIKFQITYPDNIENLYLPSMLIQPLVENAFIHGIEKNDTGQGKIRIDITLDNEYLQIKVFDNGKGIPPDKISSILEENSESVSGLRNIKERLELYFKQKDLLEIDSNEGRYTEVTLKIPLLEEDW